MPGYCYLCEENSIGYMFGGYFCEECDKIKKLVEFLGSTKILESVRFKMEKIEETKV
jgi:hexokinase